MKKEFSIFLTSGFKNSIAVSCTDLRYVRHGKELITSSMELAKTQCYEFECFEDNYSLARRDVGLTQGRLT